MKKIFNKMDKSLLILIFIYVIFGLIMIFSASSMESYMRYDNSPYYYLIRQSIILVGGLIAFFVTLFIPSKMYKYVSFPLMLLGIAMLLGLTLYGKVTNNALSWFDLGFFNLQPSEVLKIFIILYLAFYYEKNIHKLSNQLVLMIPLVLCAVGVILVVIQPDYGTGFIIFLLTMLIFYAIPMDKENKKHINRIFIGIILILITSLIITKGSFLTKNQRSRFNIFNPCERYQEDSGYQLCNSYIAFKNGNLFGRGIGESTQKYLYLPESYTDFIFPIIVEEWGLIVGIVIIIGYGFMIFRILLIAKKSSSLHGSIIAYGCAIYIFLHVIINLMGVTGLTPLTGVPLPFLSYGGSYTLSLLVILGITERIAVESNNEIIKKKRLLKKQSN